MAYHLGYAGGYGDGYCGGYTDTGTGGYDYGAWFRHADGRLRFVTGPSRGKFYGFSDWTRVSNMLRFRPDPAGVAQAEIEDACWPVLALLSGESADVCKTDVDVLCDPAFTT